MNQLFDSPLEALAFSYVSFGIITIVKNLWTWVAVITGTAAVSFWRIRVSAAATTSSYSVKIQEQDPSTPVVDRPVPKYEEKPTASASVSGPALVTGTSVCQSFCSDGVTKSGKLKLTVYFEEDTEEESTGVNTERSKCGEYREGVNCGGEWWESWERVLRLRKGEMGWYRNQDLTAINGNVVRLWDESCRRGRMYSSSCSVSW